MKAEGMNVIFERSARQKSKFFTTSLYHLPRREQTFLHYHDMLELGVCLSGGGECLTENGKMPYSAGDAQVIPPYQAHYDIARDDDTLWMFMNIDVPRISSPHLTPDPAFFIELAQKCNAWGVFTSAEHPHLHRLITDIAALMQAESADQDTAADLLVAKLSTLLIELSRGGSPNETSLTGTKKNQSILPAMHCVSATLKQGQRPTPRQMADACFMSKSYFRRIFTAVLGEPPKSYITRMQVQKAAGLLVTTDLPLAVIAADCGFEDNSTFYRCFLRIYGMAPSDYRKKR